MICQHRWCSPVSVSILHLFICLFAENLNLWRSDHQNGPSRSIKEIQFLRHKQQLRVRGFYAFFLLSLLSLPDRTTRGRYLHFRKILLLFTTATTHRL
uniref:Uncharacterized protein n=1 Tax=Anopheles darlingi TaxID=43151 RepID=A0A2M4DGN9_ANODA